MKRLLLTGLLTLGLAAPAQAHYLTVPYARGLAVQAAEEVAAEEAADSWRVGTCSRVNVHVVLCRIAWTIPRNGTRVSCAGAVRIWIRGTSYKRYWNVASVRCP